MGSGVEMEAARLELARTLILATEGAQKSPIYGEDTPVAVGLFVADLLKAEKDGCYPIGSFPSSPYSRS
jgi:hypothetical protein